MRKRGRVDANQRAIVAALRKAGASVLILSNVGQGCPDVLLGLSSGGGHNVLAELKDGSKPPSERQLTPAQLEFRASWRGEPPVLLCSVDEALQLVGVRSRPIPAATRLATRRSRLALLGAHKETSV